jgi:DNA-binding NarL/FixJ family response regulator
LENERPRVLLADDHPGILEAVRRLLDPTCDIVGQVSDGAALLDAAASLTPDVIVVDVSMPRISGIEACRRIKQASPPTKVILLTADASANIRQTALAAGATAFVAKDRVGDELLPAVHEAFTSR